MCNLYILTGPAGVGKSTISNKIAAMKDKSVLIEGDDIYHQVVGGYVSPWLEGNHLDTFWKVCINIIRTYLEDGYDVVFNYIIEPDKLDRLKDSFKSYDVKFIVLMVNEDILLKRDKERPEDCQMKERCIVLLNSFKNHNYDEKYILDTSNITIADAVNMIESENRFII